MEINTFQTIGKTLRAIREERGWDLERVSRKTYIRVSYLAAVEEERYADIGDAVFVKGFIRNYANVLGLDGDMAVMQWNKEQKTAGAEPEISPRKPTMALPSEAYEVGNVKKKKRPFTVAERAIITLIFIAGLLVWAWMVYL
jgi:cytoskeletal protein RodZ